ncbi:MAG: UvrD-helicase domain-containing protein [Kiritimatiellae bacterium]|nr:UvrD-helicase domain-containing protein [Kiritimatiellia bacterium]
MSGNILIEASAGTGKTQALAERLIELIRGGVKPQEIVALTFSRAAAGEIFERFVTLLAEKIEKGEVDATRLREVIATQHLSQIGTLDSFLMRIVRSFPLELGLQGQLTMMNEYEASSARARVSFGILRRTDAALKRAFNEAFALAMNRENVRSFTDTYRKFITAWHERYLSMPDEGAWRRFGKFGRFGEFGRFTRPEGTPAELEDFYAWVEGFRGSFTGVKGLAKKFLDLGDDLYVGSTVEVDFNRRHRVFGGEDAKNIRAAIDFVYGYVVRMKTEMAKGIYTLVSSFEGEYAKSVRRAGRLVFADVPRLILGLGEDARLALEYRMDSKIRAWALDEFQDTSREQWSALGGLIEEAKQSDGEKSVFVVGDRKQAIYGWRNGDVRIFTRERESGAYRTAELKKSWRYGEPLVKAINAVFVDGRLRDEFPAWESPRHETAKPELGGFVQTVESSGPKMENFVEPIYNALKAVDPVKRGISAAVLVRTNTFGEYLAAKLKRRGLEGVVWEGESGILDTPALLAFVDTLYLADHPGDRRAYEHFRRSPLAKAKYGERIPEAAEISGEFALAFATKGLVRTFRELRACLPEDPAEAWSAFTEDRFTDMLRAAAEFELTLEPGVRLADFVSFLAAKKKRTVAEPGKIRILTIHRSKGLGFDYVVLPLYEHDALDAEPEGPLVGEDWILPDPGARVTAVRPEFRSAARARKDRAEQEALCAYYVAMTRAKRAMTIILHPAAKTTTSLRFSQFVREAIPGPIGDPAWHLSEGKRSSDRLSENGASAFEQADRSPLPHVRAARRRVARRLPSLGFHDGQSAGELFAPSTVRSAAIERGVAAHAEYEKIEWIESPKDDFERALAKPEGLTALWREKAFEVFADGAWVSGRFDRVVFANGRATVLDFKTNAIRRGESAADFEVRMRETYAGQMRAYRAAVCALTGLPEDHVESRLLLVRTASVCTCS